MSATTRTEQVAWLEENLAHFPPEKQEQVKATLAIEGIPDIVISSIYGALEEQMADIIKAAEEEKKIEEFAEQLFQETLDGYQEWEENPWMKEGKGKCKENGKMITTSYKISDKRIACLLLKVLKEEQAQAKRRAQPKKGGGKKLSGTRERRKKGATDAWYLNTEEDAKGEYKKGMWACKTDIEAGSTYEDNMKVYEKGKDDPRPDKTGKLENDLTKYQYKAPVRSDTVYDAEDGGRCKGAVGWKAGRYGCKFAADKGFKGTVMAQCSSKAGGSGYCDKCGKTSIDFFSKSNRYIKADIPWCEAFDGEFIQID
jgi:hypothetical protein